MACQEERAAAKSGQRTHKKTVTRWSDDGSRFDTRSNLHHNDIREVLIDLHNDYFLAPVTHFYVEPVVVTRMCGTAYNAHVINGSSVLKVSCT